MCVCVGGGSLKLAGWIHWYLAGCIYKYVCGFYIDIWQIWWNIYVCGFLKLVSLSTLIFVRFFLKKKYIYIYIYMGDCWKYMWIYICWKYDCWQDAKALLKMWPLEYLLNLKKKWRLERNNNERLNFFFNKIVK